MNEQFEKSKLAWMNYRVALEKSKVCRTNLVAHCFLSAASEGTTSLVVPDSFFLIRILCKFILMEIVV